MNTAEDTELIDKAKELLARPLSWPARDLCEDVLGDGFADNIPSDEDYRVPLGTEQRKRLRDLIQLHGI